MSDQDGINTSTHTSRREWLRRSVGTAAALAGAVSLPKLLYGQAARASGPNVLFIGVDDLNDWIGPLGGHPQTKTPHLDALAERGVTFTRAYCQAPACNPSRTSLMTGIRPSTSGVYTNNDAWRKALPDAVTLPQHFMLHGYRALGGGKTFHGSQNDAASWEAYHQFNGFLRPPSPPVNGINKTAHFDWSGLDVENEETTDTQLADWASNYLSEDHDRPFFMAVGFYRPHLPWYAPQKHFDRFPPEETELPATLDGDVDDLPKSSLRNFRDHENVTRTGQWNNAVASYLACINYADSNVGRVLKALEEGPHADNTIIVVWSDHGWQLGEKKQWRKFTLWERSARVVMMMAGPGVGVQGRKCARTVELLDMYPTLVDLCGLPDRPELEGQSLRPLLADPNAAWDKPAITSISADKVTVRTERWRYSQFPDGEELYDHDKDPREWTNLAGDAEYSKTKMELAALLPKNPSRKKIPGFFDLPPDEQRLQEVAPGRFPMSDPTNYVPLSDQIE